MQLASAVDRLRLASDNPDTGGSEETSAFASITESLLGEIDLGPRLGLGAGQQATAP